ncbi:pentatricopeptide repeat-containing protein At2g41080-like [Selaginella moellendorffii]|uniref:pentatricopeptide repeat-containing protein At2g41080-like n=1 Tax=Selaginella moellendorffii TaxID=88036 RepID=UPI000D1C53AD|nr:pentatricopeptide repeat-containing protein At2g41080-like [Selaginella moellendorffii]|eukprot:XP_024517056.1 pentatricopeptide repeat-containing protein At2g41080-like [Selaginella moellendorffii]
MCGVFPMDQNEVNAAMLILLRKRLTSAELRTTRVSGTLSCTLNMVLAIPASLIEKLDSAASVETVEASEITIRLRHVVTRGGSGESQLSPLYAYTLQGRSIEALERFYSMIQEEGCKADDVSFVSVLNACSHGGLVGKGRQLLDEMPKQYGVKPRLEHYVCLIDMLGRANLLDEAVRVLRAMPFEPDAVVCTSLLGACRKWKNYTIGKLAFERLVEMDPKSGTPYALMANIFGNLGMLSERAAVVERMRGEGSFREPGRSWWTDVSSGKVHSFSVGDRSHSQSDEIAAKLKQLLLRMKEEGYASDVINVLKDIPEEEKEDHLCGHSEKLVLGCALVNSHQKETIRIVKNLRVCDDCHAATALISKLEKRLILCKDASRVHVFQDGRCSCDNYF